MQAIRLTRERGGVTIDTTAYPTFLDSIRDRLPPGALAYAKAAWHYDFRDPRCPHDAALQQFLVSGGTLPESEEPRRAHAVELTLLGSHRDGTLKFRYECASGIELSHDGATAVDYGDVIVDEVRLGENSPCVHEIAFEHGTLTIEAVDFVCEWSPIVRESST